ncbi:MAG: UDP-N-acetylmuramoyl-L-alanyl-D-glutamate--2,6-diaminopimelate ligase [Acidobacteriaceae bacterium]|nr:UDP-N-acetylmuramoyl-L-alanyl-D-glutamate--2,6-diaminopimelate ligase [Acidobacteriaceae bacterium]
MTLEKVLSGVPLRSGVPASVRTVNVTGLQYDSRKIQAGNLFVAFPGAKVSGLEFAQSAIDKGAVAVMSELPAPASFAEPWIEVIHGRQALAIAARNFYLAPDARLGVTGVTGTNGKTTTTFLIDAILRYAGKSTALMGTIEYRLGARVMPAVNTTPESLDLYRIFAELREIGGSHVTMEVSSHALALGRVYGIAFHTAVFTNLTRDHLDFHGTMERYLSAKALLFHPEGAEPPRWAVLNHDDAASNELQPDASSRVLRYGFNAGADVRATGMQTGFDGLHFTVEHEWRKIPVSSPMVGHINVLNILAASCTALTYGLDWELIRAGIAHCPPVPGRFERVDAGQPFLVVVDYAHTDDAIRNVIRVARGLNAKRVITLFGCGGDRDRSKRPLMAAAAAEASDFVVLTSDNPRSEDPIAIMNDALVGLRRYDTPHLLEPDRETAIYLALKQAGPGDIVILAGKGHEPYQVLRDRTIDFDDRQVARAALNQLGYDKGR